MPYAAQADLLTRITGKELIQLTDDTGSGEINEAILASNLAEASGVIEGFCRARYQTPLQPTEELMRLCRDLTIYLLFSRRVQPIRQAFKDAYQDAMSFLKRVADGAIQLDQPVGNTPQTPVGAAVTPTRQSLRFTECNIEGFD